MRDSGLTPAAVALDARQQRFVARLANACEGSEVNRPVRPGSLRTGTDGKVAVRPRVGQKRRRLFVVGRGRTAMTAK
jgi:hypothetical protein